MVSRPAAGRRASAERTQRVEDRRHVDQLLDQRPHRRPEQAERAADHEREREPHAHDDGLDRDRARPAGDRDRVHEPVQSIRDEHGVGRLRGGGRAPRAHGDAHIGGRERRRVVQPVSDHHDHAGLALGFQGLDLLRGIALGHDPVDAERRTDGLGHVGMVAGDHDHAFDPGTAERSDHAGCVRADRVVDDQGARDRSVDRHEDARGAVQHRAPAHLARARRHRRSLRHVARLPERHAVSVDRALDPGSVAFPDVGREGQLQATGPSGPHERRGQHVRRDLVERRGQAQHPVQIEPVPHRERLDVAHLRDAGGERPRLVQHEDLRPRERLEHAASLHDDPPVRGAGDPGHDRDRHRQQQRARRGHDEDRQGSGRITRRPRHAGDGERDRHEDRGVPIGEPDERRLLALGLLYEPHDPGIRAPFGGRRRQEVERAAGVHRTGPDRIPGHAFDRARLPREGRLVQDGVGRCDPVDRDHGARLHQQTVAAPHLPDRTLDEIVPLVPRHRSRSAIEQRRKLTVRPPVREGLERLAGGEHQGDHRAGEVLLEGERASHREQRDHIDARLASQQSDHHVAE